MAITPEQMTKVIEVLTEKTRALCATCGHDEIDIQTLIAIVPLYHGLTFPLIPAQAVGVQPCIVGVCRNCGLTHLFNIHVLGLAELLGIPPAGRIF